MKDNGIGFYLGRIAIYALLVGFAWLMLFPFTYMMMSSLKTSDDVFHAPPRLLPYSPETTEIEGEQLSLFEFEVDGQVRQMVPTDENIRFGFFTTEDLVNVEESRESEILYEIPLEEATELREIVLTSP
ncbi:MAG: hypothetical protein AAFV33_07550, partial [Chloroflexota bacterium]